MQISQEQAQVKLDRMCNIYLSCQKAIETRFKEEQLSEESLNKLTNSLFIQINQQLKSSSAPEYEKQSELLLEIFTFLNSNKNNKKSNNEIVGGTISIFIQFNKEYRF